MNKPTLNRDTSRPYRLWDANNKCQLNHRWYLIALRGHEAAVKILLSYQYVGTTYELYNIHTGRLLAQYTRTITGISIHREK